MKYKSCDVGWQIKVEKPKSLKNSRWSWRRDVISVQYQQNPRIGKNGRLWGQGMDCHSFAYINLISCQPYTFTSFVIKRDKESFRVNLQYRWLFLLATSTHIEFSLLLLALDIVLCAVQRSWVEQPRRAARSRVQRITARPTSNSSRVGLTRNPASYLTSQLNLGKCLITTN